MTNLMRIGVYNLTSNVRTTPKPQNPIGRLRCKCVLEIKYVKYERMLRRTLTQRDKDLS